jgi:hypothetical protein
MRRLFAAVGAACLLIAVAVPSAFAGKPETFTIDQSGATDLVDDIVDGACGLDLETSVSGHVILSVWFDAEGNPIREIDRYSTRFVFRNPDTGAWYRFTDAGPDVFHFNWDAGMITQSLIGRSATGSGYAGKVTLLLDLDFNQIGDPIKIAGVELGDWVENVCEAVG